VNKIVKKPAVKNFKNTGKRDFLTVRDLSAEELEHIFKRAAAYKRMGARPLASMGVRPLASMGVRPLAVVLPLAGMSIGLIFEKASTRTRISFEVGVYQLGAQPIYIKPEDSQMGRGETVADTARVFSRYLHGVIIRTFEHSLIEEFARHASIPVINGLTDTHHPCQALADAMTIFERKGAFKGVKVVYVGDGNNVANSLIEISARLGMDLTVACPKGYEPDDEILKAAKKEHKSIRITNDPVKAAKGADVLYTDVWVSMGDNKINAARKRQALKKYQINDKLLEAAAPDVIVLHCLPAHRGQEITDEVMDGPQSAVFDQAENRLHTQKAVLEMFMSPDAGTGN
jgi:ornithine carbamoyltransferase